MENRVDDAKVAYPLFQMDCGGSIPTSTLNLRVYDIDRRTMEELNRQWHSVLPEFKTACPCKVYFGAEFDGRWYAVAAWSHPVSRLLPNNWLELRRLAISDEAPKNTASWMIGFMVRDIKKRFPDVVKLISYQDCDNHEGVIYKASGFKVGNKSDGGFWSRPSRYRKEVQSNAQKIRWELDIKQKGK